jgi:hypothetical protein
MPFYLAQLGNSIDGYEDIYEFCKDEIQATIKFNSLKSNSDKIYAIRKANSLAELLFDYCYGYAGKSFEKSVENKYKEVIEKYGLELLKSEFTNYEINEELFNEIRKISDSQIDEIDEEDYSENKNHYSEMDAAEDEMKKWDEEDPSWRIANDLD